MQRWLCASLCLLACTGFGCVSGQDNSTSVQTSASTPFTTVLAYDALVQIWNSYKYNNAPTGGNVRHHLAQNAPAVSAYRMSAYTSHSHFNLTLTLSTSPSLALSRFVKVSLLLLVASKALCGVVNPVMADVGR